MRKALLLSTALTLGALNPALAGGPVVIAEEPEVVEAKPASSSGALIPLLLRKRQGNPVGAAAWLIWDRCLALV